MPGYLLDANVISYFLRDGHDDLLFEVIATAVDVVIVEEVRDELSAHKKFGSRFAHRLEGSSIIVVGLELGSKAADLYARLHPDPTWTKDKGEHASIAWAALHPELVFVANDKNALWLALAELHEPGERMIGVRVFLRRMGDTVDGLSRGAIEAVASACQGRAPSWWGEWITTRT